MRYLIIALAAFATPAAAAVDVARPWSRPAVAGATGAGFMTLTNRGKAMDALVAAESPAARRVEIHQSRMAGGVASMRKVERLAIPAGGAVTFAPGGYHLMFVGLAQPLRSGQTLPATLTFASGAKVKVVFQVGMGPPDEGEHHHH